MNGTHIEKPCNQVLNNSTDFIASSFNAAAEAWWKSVGAEPDSFTKPVYQLGLKGEEVSNVEAQGAVKITRGSVTLTSRASYGQLGDNVCMKAKVSPHGVRGMRGRRQGQLQIPATVTCAVYLQKQSAATKQRAAQRCFCPVAHVVHSKEQPVIACRTHQDVHCKPTKGAGATCLVCAAIVSLQLHTPGRYTVSMMHIGAHARYRLQFQLTVGNEAATVATAKLQTVVSPEWLLAMNMVSVVHAG
jgi:hypothetical protein